MGAMGLLWGSGDVTIQVINAVKERSITQEFDKKLVKSGLAVHKVVEGGRYIVTLGTYKDAKAAQTALKKARMVVCKEAFIRPVKRDQAAAVAQAMAKTDKVADTHAEVKPATVEVHPAVQAAVAAPVVEHMVTVAVKPIIVEVKKSPEAAEMSGYEKKELYKSEIAQAINYYKNSPYHRFEPVMLQH